MKYEYKLSICMMVKNEEKSLPRCLEKLNPIIQSGLAELIVVDTGSGDNTVEIARKYTDKVYYHKWNKNFSEMRNITISYAKGEWIFIIDADERLDDTNKLISLLNSTEMNKYKTIMLQVKNLYNYTDEDKYNLILSPRIFKNDGEFRYEGSVHNQPIFKGPNLSIDISLTHYGYISTDKELMENKFKRTSELLKFELEKEPNNLYYLYQLGITYDMHGDKVDSLKEFRKAYSILKNMPKSAKKNYTYIFASHARIAYGNREFKEVIKIASETIDLNIDYIDMYYLLGLAEKQLGNKEDSKKYFTRYINIVDKYNELEISKDLTIIMYHIDKESKSTAYFELTQYYIENEEYVKAYDKYVHITNTNQKIYCGISILTKLKNYTELRNIYSALCEKKDKDTFLSTLEEKIKNLSDEEKTDIYKQFSIDDDTYSLFNKVRLCSNKDEKITLTRMLMEKLDLNKEPLFYTNVFSNIKENVSSIIVFLKAVEEVNIRNIVKYLIESDKEFTTIFEDYILLSTEKTLDLDEMKVLICTATILLLINIEDQGNVNEKYKSIFSVFVNLGTNFVSEVYRIDRAESIYRNVSNMQERFFIIMYMIKNVNDESRKLAIKLLIEAVNTYEAFAKYIDIYKNELFDIEPEDDSRKSFEIYKTQIKGTIKSLIDQGDIYQANEIIKEYEKIVDKDIEIYSMKAIVAIMENRIDEAEKVLEEGLKIEQENSDLLFNLSYIKSIKSDQEKAVELYSAAKLHNPSSDTRVENIILDIIPIDNNNLRVLNGTMEIANQMNTITTGLRKIGVDASSVNYYENYLGYKSDKMLNINSFGSFDAANKETKKLAAEMISHNDVFHFHFGTTLTLDNSDLPLLNELGKKIVMHHWGSDVRMYSQAVKFNPYAKVKDQDEVRIRKKLDTLSKHISHCIIADFELYEYVKDFYPNVHFINQAINLENYKVVSSKNDKILIVHAPSSPEFKGTKYILNAVEELRSKYDFEFKLIQGMPHEEAKKIYQKADLIIDQLHSGSYGLFSLESMAMGKPVVCWISDYMKSKYPTELPIISANPDNIKQKIEYMINNKDCLSSIGKNGREYVEKYHDMNKISEQILNIYKSI